MFISSLCLRRSLFLVFLLKAVQAPSMPSYLAQEKKKGIVFHVLLECVYQKSLSRKCLLIPPERFKNNNPWNWSIDSLLFWCNVRCCHGLGWWGSGLLSHWNPASNASIASYMHVKNCTSHLICQWFIYSRNKHKMMNPAAFKMTKPYNWSYAYMHAHAVFNWLILNGNHGLWLGLGLGNYQF